MVPVTGGAYYTFSDWYKSNVSTALSVYYELETDTDNDNDGLIDGHWANLFSGISPGLGLDAVQDGLHDALRCGPCAVRAPHRSQRMAPDRRLRADGGGCAGRFQQADDQPDVRRWVARLLELRPGSAEAKGFKTTQYVPTGGLTSTPRDTFMMTPDEITTLAREGHEIAAHSVSHPFMTTLSDAELAAEFGDSKRSSRPSPVSAPSATSRIRSATTTLASSPPRRRLGTARVVPSRTVTTPNSTSSPTTSASRT